MPIYTFKCRDCGYTGEYLLPLGKSPDSCEDCGAGELERVLQGQTFSVHGDGSLEVENPHPTGFDLAGMFLTPAKAIKVDAITHEVIEVSSGLAAIPVAKPRFDKWDSNN